MKKLKIMLIIVFVILMFATVSKASSEDSFKLSLEPSENEVKIGESFDVKIYLDEIQVVSGEQGIAGYTAKIVYDKDLLTLEKVSACNGWEVMENEDNVVVNTSNAEVVKTKAETIIVTFKVNDNVEFGDTNISIEDIKGTSIAETIVGTGTNATIQIIEDQGSGGDNQNPDDGDNQNPDDGDNQNPDDGDNQNPGDGDNQNPDDGNNQEPGDGDNQNPSTGNDNEDDNQPGNSVDNKQNSVINSISADNEQKYKGSLPYAGVKGCIIVAIIFLIVMSIVYYYNYKKYKKV